MIGLSYLGSIPVPGEHLNNVFYVEASSNSDNNEWIYYKLWYKDSNNNALVGEGLHLKRI